ncbi:Coatomer subunit beta' (CopB') [Monocercomonoides exilis]|uniref:Coatomer subunit beta' (CopB') n=1 Tax=Monocercomonoides exilis TaxID=2049356 RepID=UPI0035598224|nr:Coatomer subunit beta' (CopB') [Monocercomonoides exilis]|eukprot:MONOS_115.1-p1 / transcript=MONOS_115.1 / gene=MONOS_115 / organism=Monocercomonoides_exilis_PA203 / gene_product= Coatomer subunit beta' (CopB') / transcript_product= Coatomer subunit beta' (CopB') / location=Mono_scaffold00002:177309-180700(+) / protein_length=953 / sequence_SO=supercontig / SO=protein_coding / is_pseudo=false
MPQSVQKKFSARSDRVKSVDLHPTEPWLLTTLYSGSILIWNYEKEELYKSIEISDVPIRCGKWIPRKNWIVVGCDDNFVRVYNYNTSELIRKFEAHRDYVRWIAVHPTQPYVLTSSDDYTVKCWDWEKDWSCINTYSGHTHFVMSVVFSPKDPNIFLTSSVDGTVKIWNLNSSAPQFSLPAHEQGANFASFYPGLDKSHLITGGDDGKVKVWDYQTKTCVATLEGHLDNISFCMYHPHLPVIITGSEDRTVRVWSSLSYQLESTLEYDMGRLWCMAVSTESNKIAVGADEGVALLKLGHERPIFSSDSSGKIIWAKHTQLEHVTPVIPVARSAMPSSSATPSSAEFESEVVYPPPPRVGEVLSVQAKPMTSCEFYPTAILHSPNARFVAVTGGGSFVVYTARQAKNVAYGSAEELVWASKGENNVFATRDSSGKRGGNRVVLHSNFTDERTLDTAITAERIFGGEMLAVCSAEEVCFYDWESGQPLERIDAEAKKIAWNKEGTLVAIVCSESMFILEVNQNAVKHALSGGRSEDDEEEEGEDIFTVVHEEVEKVKSVIWEGDALIFNTADNRLCTLVGTHMSVVAHLDSLSYILRYARSENAVYLITKSLAIWRFPLFAPVLDLQCAVASDMSDDEIRERYFQRLNTAELRNAAARFLETADRKALALSIAEDLDLRLDLALGAGMLEKAVLMMETAQRAMEEQQSTTTEKAQTSSKSSAAQDASGQAKQSSASSASSFALLNESAQRQRWKRVGDAALREGKFAVAERCYAEAQDLSSLFLLSSCNGDASLVKMVGKAALAKGEDNTAFFTLFLQRKVDACVDLLLGAGRYAEAAFFARAYAPSRVKEAVDEWQRSLKESSPHFPFTPAAPSASPSDDTAASPSSSSSSSQTSSSSSSGKGFTQFDEAVDLLNWLKKNEYNQKKPACDYSSEKLKSNSDFQKLIEEKQSSA